MSEESCNPFFYEDENRKKGKGDGKTVPIPLTSPAEKEMSQKEEDDSFSHSIVPDRAQEYCTLLKDLGLNPSSKLTLKIARTVDTNALSYEKLTSPDQIPTYILKTLMIVNYHAREFKIETANTGNYDPDSDSDESDIDNGINPMDALLALFDCSDYFLRRDIAMKLSACQLSVPFLLPDPAAPSEKFTILLSALELIMKCWKGGLTNGGDTQQVFATEFPFPVVTFIRIGEISMSKSLLLNRIISGGNGTHGVFFHKDMKGGNVERKFVDGLVELSWYLPGSEENMLQDVVCFTNLRGDARKFQKQLDVMSKISSVLCILLTPEYPNETTKAILDNAISSHPKVIFIFTEKNTKEAKKYFDNLKKNNSEKITLIWKSRKGNEHDFTQKLREKIQKDINVVGAVPLAKSASCTSECAINIDGDKSHSSFEESVSTWLKLEDEDAKELLKLQTHVPLLADLEREIYSPRRQNQSKGKHNSRDMDEIYADMAKEKEKQMKSFSKMDERIVQCLNSITVVSEAERNYAVSKLKHQLNKMSLKTMTKLHDEYHVVSMSLQNKRAETDINSDVLSSEEKHLKQLEESISKCSFGLEHIIRELAQLYQLSSSDIMIRDYASAAADMLLSGHPLELVDGDSSYIPMKWFNAVYSSLKKKTDNAKVSVISVLGIQSSGKSTMLNTMFGLEFAVSAGRCTRGAFVSLIPISQPLKNPSKPEYILIIDTEGLRGTGDPQLREHDNELSTFSIGVADLTIVNIFGENHNEMKEFLEIAVHAFLKMKLVKEKKVCKIVHQNVAATDAAKKLAVDRSKLKQDLDKMTKVAAIQENCEDQFQKFNDIISFDENDDVFYIPSFLKGCPPMAPVSPDYGRAIQNVKKNIISTINSTSSKISIAKFRERVENLWKAMLKENFIFSFRNTIEVRAYTCLDRKYFEESVNLMVTGMAELERKIQVSLSRSTDQDERCALWAIGEMKIAEEAEEIKKKLEKAMEDFFETSEDKATLEQWRENIMKKIEQHKESQVLEVTRNCLATFNHLQDRQDVEEEKLKYEKNLLATAREFITSRNELENPLNFEEEFDQQWKKWMTHVPHCKEKKVDVNKEMVHVLSTADGKLNTEMTEKLNKRDSIKEFRNMVPVVDKDQLSITYVNYIKNFLQQYHHQCVYDARIIKDKAVNEGKKFANDTSKSGVRCRRNDLTKMYQIVTKTIAEESRGQRFIFKPSVKCDILLYTFATVYDTFDKMEERYFEERDIRSDLERNLRPKLRKYFLNLCDKMENDVLAATSLFDVLQDPIESELNRAMSPAVAREILKVSMFQSKATFHASVLIQLGEKHDFESYIPYFENPVEFLKGKLAESIEKFCLGSGKAIVESCIKSESEKIQGQVFSAISSATEKLTKCEDKNLTFWIERFVEACSTLEITKKMFAVAAIDDVLQDIDVFDKKVREHVAKFIQKLINQVIGKETIEKWNPSPHDHLFTSMFGCECCCPFCKALCDQTIKNHGSCHSTRIHRPQGLTGYRYEKSQKLVTNLCTTDVDSDTLFRNKDKTEWHPYKNYKEVNDYYGSWSIPPDSSFEASKYWQWFLADFSKELAEYYKVKQPDIPPAWKSIRFKDAVEQLQQEYNFEAEVWKD